ncbi:stage III sporulation protein AD [Abyssisolibacter fermentans]|uniref:stage III sporulation protein AD n=1 Tax=Abyssisolibacter fermentans TaxID=1766203 RepID=UPI00082ED299|nr:stage III sporulation protein AD [Abyssisolibacter fermentans]
MEIFQIVGIGIVATILAVLLKEQKSEMSLYISIATGLLIFFIIISKLEYVIETLEDLANKVDINFVYTTVVLKIVGISYVAEFGAQIAKDAKQNTIGQKIELAGKVIIMVISIPIFIGVMDLIVNIMP